MKKRSETTKPENALGNNGKFVTKLEYVCIILQRVGGMFGTTLTGTLASAFLLELYFGPVGVNSKEIAKISGVQTALTTVVSAVMGLIAGIIVQKWKSRWGRFRQWNIICLVPMFALTALFFYVPKGWTVTQMTMFRYGIALCQTVFGTFNTFGQNVYQVISPNPKEKKTLATVWQLSYYIGYGGAYLATYIYGLFSDDKNAMYMTLALVAAVVTAFGKRCSPCSNTGTTAPISISPGSTTSRRSANSAPISPRSRSAPPKTFFSLSPPPPAPSSAT